MYPPIQELRLEVAAGLFASGHLRGWQVGFGDAHGFSSADINAQVPTSKQEKRAQTQVAKLGGGEEVLIAAK